jgi:putative PEP-CTERM system TPR-repeat lipoprotein
MKFLKSMVCASIVIAISACSDNQSAQTYINKAESLIIEKQNNAAIISLKNAIKIDAKNAQARFLLGQLYLSNGDAENAAKELERANQLKFSTDKVLPLLARAYMLTEYDEDVLSLSVQENLLSQPNTQFLAYKTMAALRTNDKELAQKTVDEALSISESDSYTLLASAYLEFSKQKISQANALVKRIVAATPNNADAFMLQGQIATADNNYSLAIDSFKQYLKLQPSSGKVQLFIADSLMKNGQYDEAEQIADVILAKIPTQPFLQYIKAVARFENKDYEMASEYANQSLSSGFNSFGLKLVAGASAFYLKNYEQSYQYLQEVIPYISPEHPARKMLAVSQLQLGLIDDISETLTGYDTTTDESAQFLSTLSYELIEVGAFDEAREMAEYAVSSDEATAEQKARSGVLKLMMNDPSGIESLELALQQNPELISAELALAFASIKAGNLPRASKIADKWLKEYPNKANGYNLQASILFKQEKFVEGKTALEKSLQVEPNNVFALTQMVELANYQKDNEQAVLLTEQALKAHPNNIEILRQYFVFHKNEAGLKVLTLAQQNNADDIQYGVLLSEALMHLEHFKKASSLLDSYQINAKTPKRYWQLLLAVNVKQEGGKEISLILDKWHEKSPYHIEPVLLLADYWIKKRLPDRALTILQDAFKKHPKNLMLHLVKMQILLDNNRVDDAKSFFKSLEPFDIKKDLLTGIEGRILLLDKDFAAAVPKLKRLYQIKPSSNNVVYLAYALEGNKQKLEAITLLEKHEAKNELDNKINQRVSLSLANMYLAEQQDKAIAEYERLVSVFPNNVVALNNLSWLYMDQSQFVKALTYAKQAYNLTNKIPNVVDTYAQVLLRSGKKVEALSKAQEAYELSKGKDIDIVLNLAEILLANNNIKEAKLLLDGMVTVTAKQKEKKQQLLK